VLAAADGMPPRRVLAAADGMPPRRVLAAADGMPARRVLAAADGMPARRVLAAADGMPARAALVARTNGTQAERGRGRDAAGAAFSLPAQRPSVRVGRAGIGAIGIRSRVRRRVAEDVVEAAQPGAQTQLRRLEHMFVRVERGADGTGPREAVLRAAQAAEPSEDQTSSLFCTRSITASVNSVVLEWPPRSGVFSPEPTVSSAAS
jgi:hypothetical protein